MRDFGRFSRNITENRQHELPEGCGWLSAETAVLEAPGQSLEPPNKSGYLRTTAERSRTLPYACSDPPPGPASRDSPRHPGRPRACQRAPGPQWPKRLPQTPEFQKSQQFSRFCGNFAASPDFLLKLQFLPQKAGVKHHFCNSSFFAKCWLVGLSPWLWPWLGLWSRAFKHMAGKTLGFCGDFSAAFGQSRVCCGHHHMDSLECAVPSHGQSKHTDRENPPESPEHTFPS